MTDGSNGAGAANWEVVSAELFAAPERVQLPSQKGTNQCVLLMGLNLISIGADPEAPDFLANVVISGMQGKAEKFTLDVKKMSKADLQGLLATLNYVCEQCFHTPRVTQTGENGTVPVRQVGFVDAMFVFQWALGRNGLAAATFPEQPAGGVAAVPDGQDVQPKAS